MRVLPRATQKPAPKPSRGNPKRNRLDVLANAKASEFVTDPFPFLVIEDAIEPKLYRQLEDEFPDWRAIAGERAGKSNTFASFIGVQSLESPAVSPLWKEMDKGIAGVVDGTDFDSIARNWMEKQKAASRGREIPTRSPAHDSL